MTPCDARPLCIRSAVVGGARVWRVWCNPCHREILRMRSQPRAVRAGLAHYRHSHEIAETENPLLPRPLVDMYTTRKGG